MIINEKKYVEDLLESGKFANNGKDAFLLVKYFYDECIDEQNTITKVLDFMYENIDDFSKEDWLDSITGMTNTVVKNELKLREINGVFVSNREMSVISSLENKHEKKCLFTLTILAKIKSQVSPNKVWVDVTVNDLFIYGNMKSLSKTKKLEILNSLKSYGYIDTYIVFNKTNNTRKMVYKSLIAECADDGLFVDEEINIGRVYDDYIKANELGWKNCSVCSELFKPKNSKHFMCKECGRLENIRKTLENKRKRCKI